MTLRGVVLASSAWKSASADNSEAIHELASTFRMADHLSRNRPRLPTSVAFDGTTMSEAVEQLWQAAGLERYLTTGLGVK
jgi:hypothetical protein